MTRFEPALENAALKEVIRAEIQRHGPIPFARYMELALYHPRYGYYCSRREKMGRAGDYLTSPEVHPVFGACIARQVAEMWERLGRPSRFDLIELGGGSGALARDILRWARREAPQWSAALRYCILEVSASLRERQRETLEDAGLSLDQVTWWDDLPAAVNGCILSNEFFDSFPVHRVVVEHGRLYEIYVGWEGDRFGEVTRTATPEVEAYFARLGLRPGEGACAEVNLEAPRWMERLAQVLERGFVLTLDYGYPAADLYAPWRKQGTLLCFYRHSFNTDPYAHVGMQDITAHVDFTTLIEAGRKHGLEPLGLLRQRGFLHNLGIAAALAPPADGRDLEEYAARRRAVLELTDSAGLGRIGVLVQTKAVSDPRLQGLGADIS